MNMSRKSIRKSISKNPFLSKTKRKKSSKPLGMKKLDKSDDMIFETFLANQDTNPEGDDEALKQPPNDEIIVRATEPKSFRHGTTKAKMNEVIDVEN